MRKVFDGIKNDPHPERDPERSEGEQSKDAMPRSRSPADAFTRPVRGPPERTRLEDGAGSVARCLGESGGIALLAELVAEESAQPTLPPPRSQGRT
jgi:hypothetical protein